jgi:hypothetical protein
MVPRNTEDISKLDALADAGIPNFADTRLPSFLDTYISLAIDVMRM